MLEPTHHREELEDIEGKLPIVLVKPESHWASPTLSSKIRASQPLSRTTLRSPPPPKNHHRWVPTSRYPRRWRPHREKLTVVAGPSRQSRRPWCHRSTCRATTVAGRSCRGPSVAQSTAEIRTWNSPSPRLISASHLTIDDHCLMRIRRPCEPASWTRSTLPYTRTTEFSLGK
jgi:hypothetical protein